MRNYFLLFFLLTSSLFRVSNLQAQNSVRKNKAASVHPYLFFTDKKIGELKEQVKKDTVMNNAWKVLQAKADKALQQNNAANSIEELALAYRMTGDQRYAAKVKEAIQFLLKKDTWEATEMLNRNPPWHAGLASADLVYKCAVGFDCVYDYLSSSERKSIAEGMIRLGIQPLLGDWVWGSSRIHSLNSMGHNWWSSAVFMAGVALLAIMNEEPQARQWAQTVADASLQWFDFSGDVLINKPRTFDREGGFYESVGYADFAMKEYLLFRLAWTNCFHSTPYEIPLLQKVGNFFIHSAYPNSRESMILNFGDSHVDNRDWYPALLLMVNGFEEDKNHWLLQQLQKGLPENQRYYFTSAFGLVYNQKRTEGLVPQQPGLPESKLYADMGWGTLRSSWKNNATLLAVKSGDTWNHAHADANSFILFHNGENLLVDGGTVMYNNPEYSNYFFQSKAHNVVLFNGEGQSKNDQYYGVKTPGKLYHLMDGGTVKYIFGDATGPTAQNFERNFRHFLWIGNVILIIDDLKAREAGKMEWLLHYADNKAVVDGLDIKVSKGNAEVLVRPLFPETLPNTGYPHDFPEKLRLEVQEGIHDHTSNVKENYYSIVAPQKMQQTKWITALILTDSTESNLPVVEKIRGNDMEGVKIIQDGMVTNVYLNLLADGRMMGRNSNNTLDGWETDAYLMAVTYPKNKESNIQEATQLFIANGSYLRKGKQEVLNSLSKVFLIAEKTNKNVNFLLQGQPLMDVDLDLGEKPLSVAVNGEKIKPEYTKGSNMRLIVADDEHQKQAAQLKR